mgnify:CR=1 FL=1
MSDIHYIREIAYICDQGVMRTLNTELRNTVSAADAYAQYDETAKQLLSNKIILAHILVKTVDEFQGMEPKRVVPYIEGCVVAEAHVQHGASLEDEHRYTI